MLTGSLGNGTNCRYACACSINYTFALTTGTVAPQCLPCVPPTALNANNPAPFPGVSTYTWTCLNGYFGTVRLWCACVVGSPCFLGVVVRMQAGGTGPEGG